jgi:hypothetical protein
MINETNRRLYVTSNLIEPPREILLNTGTYTLATLRSTIQTGLTSYSTTTVAADTSTLGTSINYTAATGSNLIIYPSQVLQYLGFPNGADKGICITRLGPQPTTTPVTVDHYATPAVSPAPAELVNNNDLVLRIDNIETILSNSKVTNRATAILFSTPNSNSYVSKQCLDNFMPLLQTQSRLQSLKVRLLDTNGNYYYTVNNDAIFLVEFYCLPRE